MVRKRKGSEQPYTTVFVFRGLGGGGVARETEKCRVGHVQEEPGAGSWKIMKASPA